MKSGKPVISASELQQLSDDLTIAQSTSISSELGMSSEIENQLSILDIVQRCPQYVRGKWRAKAFDQKHFLISLNSLVECPLNRRIRYMVPSMKACKSSEPKSSSCHSVESDVHSRQLGQSAYVNPGYDRRAPTGQMSQCVVCNGNHRLFYCHSFKSMQPRARFDIVRSNKLCFVCLLPGHFVTDCRKQITCSVPTCGKRHTKFIHLDNQSRADVRPTTYANTGNEGSASSASVNAMIQTCIYLL